MKKKPGGRPFTKGHSGNPEGRKKGVPNRATREVKAFCEGILHDPRYRQALFERAYEGRLHSSVECLLYYYAYGKPKERIEHSGSIRADDVTKLTTQQLEKIHSVMKEGEDGG